MPTWTGMEDGHGGRAWRTGMPTWNVPCTGLAQAPLGHGKYTARSYHPTLNPGVVLSSRMLVALQGASPALTRLVRWVRGWCCPYLRSMTPGVAAPIPGWQLAFVCSTVIWVLPRPGSMHMGIHRIELSGQHCSPGGPPATAPEMLHAEEQA